MSYLEVFLEKHLIELPKVDDSISSTYNLNGYNIDDYYLDYNNFSLLHNPIRYFPIYTAANINGKLFKKIARADIFETSGDKWQKDDRIPLSSQLGHELYSADKSDFDKGHLTKREDVQWGNSLNSAREAAASTFYFTNAVPQIDRLNRGVWRRIEDYILHKEVIKNNFKISLFTGPVLKDNDPEFVTDIKGKAIKLPYLFWKVIYYTKNENLFYTGFLTSQKGLLSKRRIIKPMQRSTVTLGEPFMNFKDAETYQVKVSIIENLTKLKFSKAKEEFEDNTPEHLILSGIDVRKANLTEPMEYAINMTL